MKWGVKVILFIVLVRVPGGIFPSVPSCVKRAPNRRNEVVENLYALRNLIESLHLGYWIMGAIFLCSVVGTSVFLERLWFFRDKNVLPRKFLIQIRDLFQRNKLEDAKTLCLQDDSSLARILLVGLEYQEGKGHSPSLFSSDSLQNRLEESGRHEAHRLEGASEILGTIAGIAPLLGLLGTVLGMIEVFGEISNEGIGNPTVLAGGIATALITTVFGIGVAVPSLVGYKYCMGRVKTLILELERATTAMLTLAGRDQQPN
jgi:biopolymer transport protein ExbB